LSCAKGEMLVGGSLICNGNKDCPDGRDEEESVCKGALRNMITCEISSYTSLCNEMNLVILTNVIFFLKGNFISGERNKTFQVSESAKDALK